jgi:hypothetical protein
MLSAAHPRPQKRPPLQGWLLLLLQAAVRWGLLQWLLLLLGCNYPPSPLPLLQWHLALGAPLVLDGQLLLLLLCC